MTAINVFLKRDKAVMMTDAAMYTPEGRVIAFGQKAIAMPSLSAAIAVRGSQKATALLAMEMALRYRSFDEMAEGCRNDLEDWFANSVMWLSESGQQDVQIVVAGFSETKGPAGFYYDSTEGGEGFGFIDGHVMGPVPDDAESDRLHAIRCEPDEDYKSRDFHPLRHGIPLMEAQRRMKILPAGGISGKPVSIVGGHILLTEIERGGISQRVVHRWPDVAGEAIQPQYAH